MLQLLIGKNELLKEVLHFLARPMVVMYFNYKYSVRKLEHNS